MNKEKYEKEVNSIIADLKHLEFLLYQSGSDYASEISQKIENFIQDVFVTYNADRICIEKSSQPFLPHSPVIVFNKDKQDSSTCLHRSCPQCHGTGITSQGYACVHGISCPCPQCTTY